MYIIDNLIEIIEFRNIKKIDIKKKASTEIIKNKQPDKINELNINLDDIYREFLISNEEIIKLNNENYRTTILEHLIKESEIIKIQLIYYRYY